MFKKVSWIVALLAALSLAVVFVGCGEEPELPAHGFEEGDVVFSLQEWIEEEGWSKGDVLTDDDDIAPLQLAGSPVVTVGNKASLVLTERNQDWFALDLRLDDEGLGIVGFLPGYIFKLEITVSSEAGTKMKIAEAESPYGTKDSKILEDKKPYTLSCEMPETLPSGSGGLRLRVQTESATDVDFTVHDIVVTYVGPR